MCEQLVNIIISIYVYKDVSEKKLEGYLGNNKISFFHNVILACSNLVQSLCGQSVGGGISGINT